MESSLKHNKTRLTKWRSAMTLDFMSSEESSVEHDTDCDDQRDEECFVVKKIPWRSEKVEDFFKNKLDPMATQNASKKSKKMQFKRI